MTAKDIIDHCTKLFPTSEHDCGNYVVAVEAKCFAAPTFTLAMNADEMIAAATKASNGWTQIGKDKDAAIAAAKNGDLVVAGMTKTELGSTNGHVAIVAGEDGQLSGTEIVPLGFARSVADKALPKKDTGPHEALKERLSKTFPAALVRSNKVTYFGKKPTL